MVNITYRGDTLVATKVTGDENVPAGKISFQADLSPKNPSVSLFKDSHNASQALPNIILSDKASKKWNTKELSRFSGIGQVAQKGYVNKQWIDGELVFINEDYFSFAWMPLSHQVLFGRPSYDLTVQMLMDQQKLQQSRADMEVNEEDDDVCILPPDDDDMDMLQNHVSKCLDATIQLVEECSLNDDSASCIFYSDDANACCFE